MAISDDDMNMILDQCIYSVGMGARMPVSRKALKALRDVSSANFRAAFDRVVDADLNPVEALLPPPGLPRWEGVPPNFDEGIPRLPGISDFILRCCVAIGEHAGMRARQEGRLSITTTILMAAFEVVKNSPRDDSPVSGPGEFCS